MHGGGSAGGCGNPGETDAVRGKQGLVGQSYTPPQAALLSRGKKGEGSSWRGQLSLPYVHLTGPQSPTSISSSSSSSSPSEEGSVVWREALGEGGGDVRERLPPRARAGSETPEGSSSGMLASFFRAAGGNFFSDSTSAFISSRSRFSLARRFWNQVITCALLRPSCAAMWSRSAGERYFWYRKRFSNS